jgi:hypothetical protein
MSVIRNNARALLIAFGIALALPAVLHFTAEVASASGYMVASGIFGETVCNPGGLSDCPDGGSPDYGSIV